MLSNNLLLAGDDAYNIQRSLRFRSSASAYLNRTPGSAGNRRTWTWSGWLKLGEIAASNGTIFSAGTASGETSRFYFRYTGSQFQTGYGSQNLDTTAAVYRDPSAWYHVLLAVDTTQATAANRLKIYVNGTQQTVTTSVSYTQNVDTAVNNTVTHSVARDHIIPGGYFDGYITELNFIDGQALTPSSFGETDSATGVWKPKKYSGTYGTNGFYLNFSDNSSNTSTTIGKDSSGNGNNWTPNNISVTSGSTYDSMLDVPTLTSADAANYPVWNPINRLPTSATYTATFSNGNLQLTSSAGEGSGNSSAVGTMQIPSTGKWYWEVAITGRATLAASRSQIGIVKGSAIYTDPGDVAYNTTSNACYVYAGSGDKAVSYGSFSAYGSAWTNGDVIGVACDWDAGTLTFYKNGTSQGTAFSGLSGSDNYFPIAGYFGTFNINFGQRPFAYTPPTGFKALNTFNLPTPTIGATASTQANKNFDVTTYTGNGSAGRVITTNLDEVGLAWVKIRSGADDHRLANIVTGGNKHLKSNATDAESTGTNIIQSFSGSTFTIGSDNSVNVNSSTYVAWSWKANGSGSSNTDGSVTSTVSVNTTSGFSIATVAGQNNTSTLTIGHGLGVAPKMIIGKSRGGVGGWSVWHTTLAINELVYLNSDAAKSVDGGTPPAAFTATSSTTFTVQNWNRMIGSGVTGVFYAFSEVAGYSRFGSYTGNGSTDGPFVFCGFRPRWVLLKNTTSGSLENWHIYDSARNTYNVVDLMLRPNSSAAEATFTTLDFVSNGFKIRNSNSAFNTNGSTYIYAAFAENPFKYSLAR